MNRNGIQVSRWIGLLSGAVLLAVALAGCGGGAAGSGAGDSGEVVVSLTDAEGDFAAYTVDVAALTLTKANGAEVSTLPQTARLDFTQYTDMTEFLTAATVPSGGYVAATLVLDYGAADIRVENAAGDPVPVDAVVDGNGDPVDQVEMTVQLEDRNRLLIAPGIPAHLQLDFNLEATNSVAFDVGGRTVVTVDPYLIADVNRVDDKIQRVRGLLDRVNPAGGSFSVIVRPFYAALTGSHSRFGRIEVATGADTLFEVDGAAFQGSAGLTALQALDPLAAVVAAGSVKFDPLRFVADQVYAGSSVPWGSRDIVSGTVAARRGDVLTVQGATLVRGDGSVVFHDQVSVTVGDDTRVTRQLSMDSFSPSDISVGQRATVFGTLTEDTPGSLELDATDGHVRLKLTTVRGSVTAVDAGDAVSPLEVDLQSINCRRIGIFDFSGTGTSAGTDADSGNYEIYTGALDLDGLEAGGPVKVRGFVQPFGAAPQDFNARTVVDVADLHAFMKVRWQPESADAVAGLAADGITLDLDGVGLPHHVFRGWVLTDLTASVQPPEVVPRPDGRGLFILRLDGVVQVVLTFEDFAADLESYLDSGWRVRTLWGRGDYDDAGKMLTADLIDIDLN